jgi:hypothetical protein
MNGKPADGPIVTTPNVWLLQAALVLFTIFSVPALIALPFWLAGFLYGP